MGTVSAIVIVCVLLISAAITLILILVTVPSENDEPNESQFTFQTFSQTNRAYEIHSPTHRPPAPIGSNQMPPADNHSVGLASSMLPITVTPISKSSRSFTVDYKVSDKEPEAPLTTKVGLRTTSRLVVSTAVVAENIQRTTPQAALETTSTRKRDFLTLTLRYENRPHESKQLELKSKVRKADAVEVETSKLQLERKIKLPPDHKIVGIAFEQQLLHVGTADGKVRIFNSTSGEQVDERSFGEKVDRIAVTQNGQIITINAQEISLFDGTQRRFKTQIPFRGKAIAVNGSEYYVLSKSNDVIAVLNEELQFSYQIHFVNDVRDTCNFILSSQQFLYVSCQGAILKLNKDGEIEERIGRDRGTFSLGITFDEHLRLIAVVRGQPLLRIFQDGKLVRNVAWVDESSVIWSEVLYGGARLHVVDYLANTLNTFHYPTDLI